MKNYLLIIFDCLNTNLTKLGAIFNSPKISALSWRISIIRHNLKIKKNKKNILLLYRAVAIEDFSHFNKKDKKKISVFIFPRLHIKKIFNVFFKKLNHTIDDNNYITKDPKIEQTKILYRNFLKNTLKILNRYYKFSSIVSFNFKYYAERELHFAASENRIKFIVLHKESLFFPGQAVALKKMFTSYGKFGGDHILTYNRNFKELILSTKIASAKQVTSIGMPRADYYHKVRKAKKKYFLIMVITEGTGTQYIKKKNKFTRQKNIKIDNKIYTWKKLSKLTIKNVLEFARKNPNIDFIFKTKGPIYDLKKIGLDVIFKDNSLNNCTIANKENTGSLIKDAKAVIGFNTTTLAEAMILNKTIIIPEFGIKNKFLLNNFTLKLGNCVHHAKNENQFISLMKKVINNKINNATCSKIDKRKYINTYIGNPDGLSTRRMLTFL